MAETAREPGSSIWSEGEEPPRHPALERDVGCDVCVLGGGIAGVSVAHALVREGLAVTLLEAARLGSGDTGATTAHLASAQDDRFVELERLHGREGARLARESHAAAVDRIERLAAEEGIDCDFRRVDGYLVLAAGQSRDLLDAEAAAARRAGCSGVERLDEAPGWGPRPCLRFPDQGRFHPLRYLHGLAAATIRRGGTLHEDTRAMGVEDGRVTTESGAVVRAGAVVVATNAPITSLVTVHPKQKPYRTYALAGLLAGELTDALWWDTEDPYHYVRLAEVELAAGRRTALIVGGEDHPTGEETAAEERWERLASWARLRFPLGDVLWRWAGQVMEPVDGLAFIGRSPAADDLYLVTGDSGQGITHGVLAGRLIADLVRERDNPWARLYDPGRITLRAAGELARANLAAAGHLLEWITGSEATVGSADDIAPGSGAVVREHGVLRALYRDPEGRLHRHSAACTHLGCVVRWNADAGSWDCPCHGSRFAADGAVLQGPATEPLGEA